MVHITNMNTRVPYQITSCDGPDYRSKGLYFPTDSFIQVHQMRVLKCPTTFPTELYWYGGKRSKPGSPSKLVQKQLEEIDAEVEHLNDNNSFIECEREGQTNSQFRNDMLHVLSNTSIESNKSTELVTAIYCEKEKSNIFSFQEK